MEITDYRDKDMIGNGIHEVKEGQFHIAFRQTLKIFVFSREVSDFRTVDYEAIAMLNVSAPQELARRLEVQETDLPPLPPIKSN